MVSVLCSRMQVTVLSLFFSLWFLLIQVLYLSKKKKQKKKEQCLGLRGGHLNTRLLLPVPQLRHKWLIPAEEPPFTFSYFLCIFFNSVISTIIFYIMEFFAFSYFSEVSSVFCTFYDIFFNHEHHCSRRQVHQHRAGHPKSNRKFVGLVNKEKLPIFL